MSKIVKPPQTEIITNTTKIIQLNDPDDINHHTELMVMPKSNSSYKYLILDQNELDKSEHINSKLLDPPENGIISAEIKHLKNIPMNYYLLLKTPNKQQCEVDINITKTRLPLIEKKEPPVHTLNKTPDKTKYRDSSRKTIEKYENSMFKGKNWFKIIIIIVAILVLIFLFNFFSKKQKNVAHSVSNSPSPSRSESFSFFKK